MRIGFKVIAHFGVVLIIGIASFLTYSIGNSGTSYACTCAPNETPQKALSESTAVFSGRVIELYYIDQHYYQVLFDVQESWKGIDEEPLTINTSTSGNTCGYDFELGNDYLVYAHGQTQPIGGKPELGTGICSRTTPISTAQADLLVLGEGRNWTSVQGTASIVDSYWIIGNSYYGYWFIIIGIPIAIIGAVGGIIGIRKWRRKAGR